MTFGSRRYIARGFTLAELLILLVLGTLVLGALYQVVRLQQRVYRHERATVSRHDALRLAAAVLSKDLMEASGSEGDFAAIAADSIALRSPVGFAIACAVDSATSILGLFDVVGRFSASAGDSLLIYHPSGWLVRDMQEINPSGASLSCPYVSGPSLGLTVRVGGSVGGVPVGAPVRAFHEYAYSLVADRGSWWLARDDGSGPEILVGPFAADGSGLAFAYVDSAGQSTSDPTQISRVDLVLVAEDENAPGTRDTLSVSVRPRNQ